MANFAKDLLNVIYALAFCWAFLSKGFHFPLEELSYLLSIMCLKVCSSSISITPLWMNWLGLRKSATHLQFIRSNTKLFSWLSCYKREKKKCSVFLNSAESWYFKSLQTHWLGTFPGCWLWLLNHVFFSSTSSSDVSFSDYGSLIRAS